MWPNYLPVLIRELYPRAKEIFLVRDFRDMARSIMAFDAKRGYAGFGRARTAPATRTTCAASCDGWLRTCHRAWHTRGDGRIWSATRISCSSHRDAHRDAGLPESGCIARDGAQVLAKGSEQVLRLPGSGYELSEMHGSPDDARSESDDRPLAPGPTSRSAP